MRNLLFLFLVFFVSSAHALDVNIADKVVYQVHLAQTKKELALGLMFVNFLPENGGMLFDVRQYPQAKMWMKNTYISLDMVFIDCAHKVVDVYENAQPNSENLISSKQPFCYILEINGGEVQRRQVAIDDVVHF